MPVLGWHILAGNHEIVDYLIAHGVELNQEFDGVDEEGNMFGIFTVRLSILDLLYTASSLVFLLSVGDIMLTNLLLSFENIGT